MLILIFSAVQIIMRHPISMYRVMHITTFTNSSKKQASQQIFGPSCFDRALVILIPSVDKYAY